MNYLNISHTSDPFKAGVPNVRWFGREGDYNVMVMDLMGPSLEVNRFIGLAID